MKPVQQLVIKLPNMSTEEFFMEVKEHNDNGYIVEGTRNEPDEFPLYIMRLAEPVTDPHAEDNLNRAYLQIDKLQNNLIATEAERDALRTELEALKRAKRQKNFQWNKADISGGIQVGSHLDSVLYSIHPTMDGMCQLFYIDKPVGKHYGTVGDAAFAAEEHFAALQQKADPND